MRKIPFVGGDLYTRSGYGSLQSSINLYPEALPTDFKGQGKLVLNPTPGTTQVATAGDGPIRGMIHHQGKLYVVSDNDFYEIDTDYTVTLRNYDNDTNLTTVPLNTTTGPVIMASSGDAGQVTLADGENLWVWYDSAKTATIAGTPGITQANPGVVTAPGHGFVDGDKVTITGVVGMTEVNGNEYVVDNSTTDTFELLDTDTSGFTAYVSGGECERTRFFSPGFATDTGDETWGTATSEPIVGGDTAWTNPSNALDDEGVNLATVTIGDTNTAATGVGTGAQTAAGGTASFDVPSYITTDDTNYALAQHTQSAAEETSALSYMLLGDNPGFSIPAGATIRGILVGITRHETNTGTNPAGARVVDSTVKMLKAGSVVGTNKASASDWPGSPTRTTYGGATDTWGTSWTPDDINDADFGAVLQATLYATGAGSGTSICNCWVDFIDITVYYTLPSEALRVTDRSGADLAATDQVTGVEVDIHMLADTASKIKVLEVYLVSGGTRLGDNQDGTTLLTAAETTYTYGGAGDMWGNNPSDLSPTVVNSESFGVEMVVDVVDPTGDYTCSVDFFNIKMYYNSSGAVTPTHVVWFDSYFIANDNGTGDIYYTSTGAQKWDNVNDKFTVERDPDNVTALSKKQRELWFFGPSSAEAWYNSGDDIPFDPIDSAFSELGTIAPYSVARGSDSIFFVSQDERGAGRVMRVLGFNTTVVSQSVDWVIDKIEVLSDAIGYVYYMGGHEFYVLTFPSAMKTLVYDITTQAWFSWESPGHGGRHLSSCHTFWPAKNKHFVGHYNAATVHEISNRLYTEGTDRIVRERVSQHMTSELVPGAERSREGGERKTLRFYSFEVDIERGHIPLQDAGQDPYPARVGLSWSDDGGKTFTEPKYREIGEVGNAKRLRWQMLGKSRDRIWKITTDAPYELQIVDAFATVEVGGW